MILTIDTGGTKTLVALFSKSGTMRDSIKFPTPQDPDEYTKQLHEVVRERYAKEPINVVVVAIPGVIDNGVVKWCGNLPWKNIDLKKRLRTLLPGIPVLVGNDAKLAALGESRSLSIKHTTALYVTISTGIGCGLVTNGHLDEGMRFSEVGHIPLEYDGRVRIWESFASGRAIVDTYKKFARDITSKRAWRQIADRMSRGFLVIIPTIQPDVIVIGGSIGTYFERYAEYLIGTIREHLPDHVALPHIVQAKHPEEAVVYGEYVYGKDYIDHQGNQAA